MVIYFQMGLRLFFYETFTLSAIRPATLEYLEYLRFRLEIEAALSGNQY